LRVDRDAEEPRRYNNYRDPEPGEARIRLKREQDKRHQKEKDNIRLRHPETSTHDRNIPISNDGRGYSYQREEVNRISTSNDPGYASSSPSPNRPPREHKRRFSPRLSKENIYDAGDRRPNSTYCRPYATESAFVEPETQPKKRKDIWDTE
jgi:hypothetical protein